MEGEHGVSQSTVCVLCEFAMMQLDQYLEDNATEVCIRRISSYILSFELVVFWDKDKLPSTDINTVKSYLSFLKFHV